MSTTGATVHTTNAVSLADEEEVKQVLLNSVLGLLTNALALHTASG